ncbi:MAG: PAS domain S-box protein, partial [Calditrichota bacterium]
MLALLNAVDETYRHFDKEVELMQRSVNISSAEIESANRDMRDIIRSIPDSVFSIDSTGKILEVRSSNKADLLLPTGELLGKKIQEIPTPNVAKVINNALQETLHTGEMSLVEYALNILEEKQYFEMRLVPSIQDQLLAIIRNRTKEALAMQESNKTNSLLKAIHNATQCGILAVDSEGVIIDYNKRFLELWHLEDDDLNDNRTGSPVAKVIDDLKEPQQFLNRIEEIYATPDAEAFDIIEFKDGRIFERASRPQVIDGNYVGRVWSFNDITKLKSTELAEREQKLFLRSIIDNTPNLISLKTLDGKFELVNDAFAEIVGRSRQEIEGQYEEKLQLPQSISKALTENVEGTENYTVEEIRNHPKTNATSFFQTSHTIFKGLLTGDPKLLSVSTDISERKKADESQRKLMTQLEDVNKELSQFAYIVSHDLKAPLRAINSLSEWLVTDYGEALDETGQHMIIEMNQRVQRMFALIEGILRYSKLGRENEVKTPVNLTNVAKAVVDLISPPAFINIHIQQDLPTLLAEETRMFQLLQNLIGNAVKYMDKDEGHIYVEGKDLAGFWEIAIRDNGPGIPEKQHENIFKIFQTLQKSDDINSTGIGLSIVKKTVE